jgi:serine/threonine protein kinase/formylglycine-generating enzyme required for sulfatase activity
MTDKLIGTTLGKNFYLIELIRRGGMSSVYKARQSSLFDRIVAVKVTHNPELLERFKLESSLSAKLQHPNILQIIDYGEEDGLAFLVLHYVEGGKTLNDIMHGPMPPVQALGLIARVLDALDYAHQRGIIHRDVKPANILLPSPERPLLADFGIARKPDDDPSPRLTVVPSAIGTAAYMAPEQAEGRDVDARADIYATGAMLYEMLTGEVPFDADTPYLILYKHRFEPPRALSELNPDIPPAVDAAVLRALEKEPAKRYQTAAEMKAALERVLAQLQRDDKRRSVTELYERGLQAFAGLHLEEAIDKFSGVLDLEPDHEKAAALLDDAKMRLKEQQAQVSEIIERHTNPHKPATPTPRPEPAMGQTQVEPVPPRDSTPEPSYPKKTQVIRPPDEGENENNPGQPHVLGEGEGTRSRDSVMARPDHIVVNPPPRKNRGVWYAAGGVVALLALLGGLWSTGALGRGAAPTATAVTTVLPTGVATAAPTTAANAPTAAPNAATVAPSAPTTAPEANATSVPLPAPAGQLVFEDEFLDVVESGLEDLRDDLTFQRGIHPEDGGVYHMRLLRNDDTRMEFLPRAMYHNFSVKLEMWDYSDDTRVGAVGQGIVFRAHDSDRYYAFLINPRAGQYNVRRVDGPGQLADLVAWKDSDVIKRNNEHNFVRIDGVGDTFTIYVNDTLVETFTDDTYASGMLGMIVSNQDAINPHMHFDKLQVWSDDQPAASERPATLSTDTGEMALIVGGEFVMGAYEDDDAQPNVVDLPDFYIDRTEVTNAAYAQCVTAGACTGQQDPSSPTHPTYSTDAQFGTYPAIHVSWQQASAFCAWANKRLPSEAEWEKAASWNSETERKTKFPWGNEFDQKQVNSIDANLLDTTAVGTFAAAVNGLFDMAGNVSEWTNSIYLPYPYNATDGREDADKVGARVYRGGSWGQSQGKLRSSFRQSSTPERGDREIGFRCAASPTP